MRSVFLLGDNVIPGTAMVFGGIAFVVLVAVGAGGIALLLLIKKNSNDKATRVIGGLGMVGLGVVLALLAAFIAICFWVAFA